MGAAAMALLGYRNLPPPSLYRTMGLSDPPIQPNYHLGEQVTNDVRKVKHMNALNY